MSKHPTYGNDVEITVNSNNNVVLTKDNISYTVLSSSFTGSGGGGGDSTSINGFTGVVSLNAGPNITINSSGNAISISGSSNSSASSSITNQGIVSLLVSPLGSDSNPSRPSVLISGSYINYPFKTLQAAQNSLPKLLSYDANVYVVSGTYDGALFQGFLGIGRLSLVGAYISSSLASRNSKWNGRCWNY
jgi:hypothetical protein